MFTKFHILELPPKQALEKLTQEIQKCKNPNDRWLLRWWASDVCVTNGDFDLALKLYPEPSVRRAVLQVQKLLNLKLICGVPYTGEDILALLGPKVTNFGKKNMSLVKEAANVIVAEESSDRRVQRMRDWGAETWQSSYSIYNGSPSSRSINKIATYVFVDSESCIQYCFDISRRAENMVREDAGLPNVGEGWISETKLFRDLQTAFSTLEVIQHASPIWLGRQHLDVFIPALSVGVEYQGPQHDFPVEYFGGEEAFKKTKQRDAKKKKLCSENNISLIYVRPGYDLDSVVSLVEQAGVKNQGLTPEK